MVHYYFIVNSQTMYTRTEKIDQCNPYRTASRKKKFGSQRAHNSSQKITSIEISIIYANVFSQLFQKQSLRLA